MRSFAALWMTTHYLIGCFRKGAEFINNTKVLNFLTDCQQKFRNGLFSAKLNICMDNEFQKMLGLPIK